MPDDTQAYIKTLSQALPLLILQGALFWAVVVGGVVGSWFFVNRRGSKLGLDWLTLHRWRMAALLLGPIAVILFYFWTKHGQSKKIRPPREGS